MVSKATAVLYVEHVEQSLPFFEAVGFQRTIEVPEGNALGFVMLQRGGAEVMLQSYTSGIADLTTLEPKDIKASRTLLFVEIDDLAAIERALKAFKIVIPRRKTPYGADETGYREPSGHIVLFAQFPKKD
jgi:hypothetical protein